MPFKQTIRYVLQGVRAMQIFLLAAVFITHMVLTISAGHAAGGTKPPVSWQAVMVVSVPTLLFDAAALAVSSTLFIFTARPAKRAHFLPVVNALLTACTSYCCDITVDTILAALYGMSVVLNAAFMHATQGIGLLLALDASMMVLFLATAALSSRMGAVILSTDAMAVPLVELQDDAYMAPGDWQVL